LDNTLMQHLFDIVLYFTLLNVFSLMIFYTSHEIHSKGLKIAGLIHEIAHNGIREAKLVEAVQLFSMQISQQQITHINIFQVYYYDRSNVNAVSCNCHHPNNELLKMLPFSVFNSLLIFVL
jgi:hypothetical protein